jgi:hypothetical protein
MVKASRRHQEGMEMALKWHVDVIEKWRRGTVGTIRTIGTGWSGIGKGMVKG